MIHRHILETAIQSAINYIDREEVSSTGYYYHDTDEGKKLLEIFKDKAFVDYIEQKLDNLS